VRNGLMPLRVGLAGLLASPVTLAACQGTSDLPSPSPAAATATTSSDCGTLDGRGCADPTDRVDLARPTFSHPTDITNPLFPIGRLRSALLLGHVDSRHFRTETTLLPRTETVVWNGQPVEVLISQYMAYLDGRVTEVALDRYAQADDGSVWYLGEDVFGYESGTVAMTEGTWLAGREGPAAMIMPAHPQVGDAYRTENAPGIVFEEVTVASVGQAVDGPLGPVDGAMVASELHVDGTREDKVFAPGYGEFRTEGGGDLEALALAVPTDAGSGAAPAELAALANGAQSVLESSRTGEWDAAAAVVGQMQGAWETLRAQDQPQMVVERLDRNLASLADLVDQQTAGKAAQRAVDVAQSVLDLALRYMDPAEVDLQRFEWWTQQLRIHAAADDASGVSGDVATLEWITDRFAGALSAADQTDLDTRLRDVRAASDAGNLSAAADHAARLYTLVRVVETAGA